MNRKFEKNTLRLLLLFGIISLLYSIRKPPVKDWLLIFLFKGFISSILDNLLVKKGYLKYPVNLFTSFDYSFIFDYLIYPVTCLFYNQLTMKSNILGILFKTLYFSVPMSVAEHFLEKHTRLIKFNKGWTSLTSFFALTFTFLISRTFIAIVRKMNNNPIPKN
ncbi:CBO0543 family protein [Bacillus sp. USDA818B3_A]|uniref:CBO0543 family protein n=1 Tax=Bacillus sp. USDA818B3_A TaxID=2698834 RepID=UPI001369CF73|nr:CBO0543 family protein [Bacillus sp. USDA818B3_A]